MENYSINGAVKTDWTFGKTYLVSHHLPNPKHFKELELKISSTHLEENIRDLYQIV